MSREYERMPNGRYRYPRSLQNIAREYTRIRIYQHRDMLTMRTYCYDMQRELNRLQRWRGQYRRQQREIIRLRTIIRQLRDRRGNLSTIRQQKTQIDNYQRQLASMQTTMQSMRRTRSVLYRDWRRTHSRCSDLERANLRLMSDIELAQSQLLAVQKCLLEHLKNSK